MASTPKSLDGSVSSFRMLKPMAVAIIFGLLFTTTMTLLVGPILYWFPRSVNAMTDSAKLYRKYVSFR